MTFVQISILRRITTKIALSLERMLENLNLQIGQFQNQLLRSRQRVTYRRMLETIPKICQVILLIITLVVADLKSLENLAKCRHLKSVLKRRKKFLKIFENISENVSSSKNRWDESAVLVSQAKVEFENAEIIQ